MKGCIVGNTCGGKWAESWRRSGEVSNDDTDLIHGKEGKKEGGMRDGGKERRGLRL